MSIAQQYICIKAEYWYYPDMHAFNKAKQNAMYNILLLKYQLQDEYTELLLRVCVCVWWGVMIGLYVQKILVK